MGRWWPGWLARFGPYSRLAVSAALHLAFVLTLLGGVLAGLAYREELWRALVEGGRDGPKSPLLGLLVGAGVLFGAFSAITWSGAHLRRLPGLARELHALLEETAPVLMDLTVEKVGDGDSATWYVHLRGRHGDYAGQEHRLEVSGLLPPWWLTAFERSREPVLVYGLPPPGPYVIEFESGALALLHPD